jgi:hypothetical protein
MTAVEQMEERAKQQQDIRQDPQQMRSVFFPEEESRDGKKTKTNKTAS